MLMKFVSALTQADQSALRRLYQEGRSHRARQRAHAILLSAEGYTLAQLAEIFAVERDTVSRWLDAWQQQGLNGLADAPKSGRPRKLTKEVEAALVDLLQNPTPALKALVQAELRKKTSRFPGTR